MFHFISSAFQLLQTSSKSPQWQTAPIRKILDHIRNSLELQVVLQTAVNEIAGLLRLDSCSFLWYFNDTQQVRIVSERKISPNQPSLLGYHSLARYGSVACKLGAGKRVIFPGMVTSQREGLRRITQKLFWLMQALSGLFEQRLGVTLKSLSDPKPDRNPTAPQKLFGYEASLLIPVTNHEGAIGFIACFSEQPRHWSATEIELLECIAETLEIAIRQTQLYEQTQKQTTREQLIACIISKTRQSFDKETILTEATQALLESLQTDRCLVHLVEDPNATDTQESIQAAPTGYTFRQKHLYEVYRPPFAASIDSFDTNGPLTQWVIQHRQAVAIPDITQDERIDPANVEYQKGQIKSSLVIPVQANGTILGLLYLNQCSHIRYWSQHDQELAQAVADQLAISLQQACLYARTQQQARESAMQAQKMSEMIEELQQTQAQLIQSEKMSSLGRMVAGVAHEINNPINFIYGNIPYIDNYIRDLLRLVQAYQAYYPNPEAPLQKLAEETDMDFLLRDLPKILKSMESGAQRIHEIVQLLQKFSGSSLAVLKPIDLNAALESTLLILHNQMSNSIEIERHYDHLPPVECYPKSINQAFLSLLTNAIEALNRWPDPNKIITLQTKYLASRKIEEVGRVQISIRDNGPGIVADIQSRIFEPFFTTKEVGQGRGLGLTMAYQTIVNQHHGQLKVRSQPSRGAEFILEIPMRHPKSPQKSDSLISEPIAAVSKAKSSLPNAQSVAAAANS